MALQATRAGLRILSPHAPTLAARWAERLFLTARRHERPSWEVEALATASAQRLHHEGGWLPVWTWPPPGPSTSVEMAPTVILVHGWEGRGSQLATFVPGLLDRGYRVIAFDAPGHGDSPLPRASIVDTARALLTVASTVGPVHGVIAHSVGGAATLLATRFGLKAERMALLAPPTTPELWTASFARTLGLDDSVKSAMIARIEARYALRFEDLDVRPDAERLRSALLVVHDRTDPVVAFESGKLLAEAAPQGKLVETTGLGHRAVLRASHVVETVTRFVHGAAATAVTFAETLEGELFQRDTRW